MKRRDFVGCLALLPFCKSLVWDNITKKWEYKAELVYTVLEADFDIQTGIRTIRKIKPLYVNIQRDDNIIVGGDGMNTEYIKVRAV